MTAHHIADPERGAQEAFINAGLERDGIGQRVCLHADRTVQDFNGRLVIECDYCPAVLVVGPGLRAELPAWYWRAKELV